MITERRTDVVGGGLIVMASAQFGAVVVLGKLVERTGLPVETMLAVRFAISAALLTVVLAALRRPLLPARGERAALGTLGVVGYAVEAALFFLALGHGTAAAVTLLFFMYPVFVTLISLAIGRGSPGWLIVGSLASAVTGAVVVVTSGGGLAIAGLGVVFALLSALSFSGYLIGADAVLKRTDSLSGSMWVSLFASGGLAVYALVTGHAEVPSGLAQWARLTGMAAATAGAFVCLFGGLRRLGPVRTSIVAATEPLAATFLAALFLNEPIRAGVVAGGVLILAGAVTAALARAAPVAEPPAP